MKHEGTLFQLKKVTGEKNIPKIWKDFEPIEIIQKIYKARVFV